MSKAQNLVVNVEVYRIPGAVAQDLRDEVADVEAEHRALAVEF